MPRIIFIQPDGQESPVEARCGTSLMEIAVAARVPGVLGECGGACACATCHLQIEAYWNARLPPPSRAELSMLCYAEGRCEASRLACRVSITEALDGMRVHLPDC